MFSKHLESADGTHAVERREVVAAEEDGEVDELKGT